MEEPGRLQSMGSLRVRHDWSDLAAGFCYKTQGAQFGALGWEREVGWIGGREAQEGDVYIHTGDWHSCTVEIKQHCKAIIAIKKLL